MVKEQYRQMTKRVNKDMQEKDMIEVIYTIV